MQLKNIYITRKLLLILLMVLFVFSIVIFFHFNIWHTARKAYDRINAIYLPVLDQVAGISLNISGMRTELFRYINAYEPSPYRIHDHIDLAEREIEHITHSDLSDGLKAIINEIRIYLKQSRLLLNRLEQHMEAENAFGAAESSSHLTEVASMLSRIAEKVRKELQNDFMAESIAMKKRLFRNNLVLTLDLAGGFFIIFMFIFLIRRDIKIGFEDLQSDIRNFSNSMGQPFFDQRNRRDEIGKVSEEFKKMAQALEEKRNESKIFQARFIQAQKMEAIGTLAGGIAHDFNNILAGIQGRTSLMLTNETPGTPCFDHLQSIEKLVDNAANLTRQLLGFARGGKYEVKPTDLNALIREQIRMFARTCKAITIHETYQPSLWTVEMDRGQISQVLLNLFVNARQAMPEGGELIIGTKNTVLNEDLSSEYRVHPGRYVQITVADKGIGMDEITVQKCFDPFFTTKEKTKGTGLGLASAYGIIKNHAGYITVNSQPGEGTSFAVYLPASEKAPLTEQKKPESVMIGTERILLVDDEEIVLDTGKQILEKIGYHVIAAAGGRQALAILKENPESIDLVILDMIMPHLDGEQTFKRIREIRPDMRVLLSSGYSLEGKAADIMKQGCNGFIQKPFGLKKLSQKVREALDVEWPNNERNR